MDVFDQHKIVGNMNEQQVTIGPLGVDIVMVERRFHFCEKDLSYRYGINKFSRVLFTIVL